MSKRREYGKAGSFQTKIGGVIEKYVLTFLKRFNRYPTFRDMKSDLIEAYAELFCPESNKVTRGLYGYYIRKKKKEDTTNNKNSFVTNLAQGLVAEAFIKNVQENGITQDLKSGITYRLKLSNGDFAFFTCDNEARVKMKEAMEDAGIIAGLNIMKCNSKRATFHTRLLEKGEQILEDAETVDDLIDLRKLV